MPSKIKALSERIENLEKSIEIAQQYLDTGEHANWHGFRPFFTRKLKNGREMPPHTNWVANVFLPRKEKALQKAERQLERLREPR